MSLREVGTRVGGGGMAGAGAAAEGPLLPFFWAILHWSDSPLAPT